MKEDVKVVVWELESTGSNKVPAGLSNVITVSGSGYHCVVLMADSTVLTWGDTYKIPYLSQQDIQQIKSIATGYDHILVLKNNGKVIAWGNNQQDKHLCLRLLMMLKRYLPVFFTVLH